MTDLVNGQIGAKIKHPAVLTSREAPVSTTEPYQVLRVAVCRA